MKIMRIYELFWETTGFIVISSLIGSVYGLIFSPITLFLLPKLTVMHVLKVFCLVFIMIGFFSIDFLINSLIGIIYLIPAFFVGIGIPFGGLDIDLTFIKRESVKFILLGFGTGIFTVLLYWQRF